MDRPIDKDLDYISAGSYSILSNHMLYRFDFMDCDITIDDDDPSIIYIHGEHLDYDTFPLAENITENVLESISNITEFFVYTGEPDEDCAEPIELMGCIFDITNSDKEIVVPDDICKGAYITRGF